MNAFTEDYLSFFANVKNYYRSKCCPKDPVKETTMGY